MLGLQDAVVKLLVDCVLVPGSAALKLRADEAAECVYSCYMCVQQPEQEGLTGEQVDSPWEEEQGGLFLQSCQYTQELLHSSNPKELLELQAASG